MSESFEKYARLVEVLLDKTKASKIPWKYESGRNIVSVWHNEVLLNLQKSENEHSEDLFIISLINRSGDILEFFNDEMLSGQLNDDFDSNYYTQMKTLYSLAMRQATGAAGALDNFIKAVENDEIWEPF